MSIVFRTIPTTRAVNPFIASSCRLQRSNLQTWRAYSHSSYGGEGEADAEPSKATRDLEHPGKLPTQEIKSRVVIKDRTPSARRQQGLIRICIPRFFARVLRPDVTGQRVRNPQGDLQ